MVVMAEGIKLEGRMNNENSILLLPNDFLNLVRTDTVKI